MAKVRAKNTATAKDMMGCFVLWSREIDVESFRLSEQQVIVQNERLFSELLEKTVRPGQKEVQQGLSMAYQIGVDEAKAISKSICNAFKFARSKIQSCSSGKKLEPAVWKFVQRLKTLSASSSSPSSRRSLDLEGSRPSVEEEVALKRKLEFGAPSKTEDEILAIYAAGSANAKSMDANVAMTGSSQDAISISESPSAVESSSETEAFQKKPGTAKPYFDPAEGCYIRLAEEGKVSRGVLEKGPAGFCLVRFEDEEPFPSEVPNLWLAPQAAESGPKLKRVRATGKGKGKGKGTVGFEGPLAVWKKESYWETWKKEQDAKQDWKKDWKKEDWPKESWKQGWKKDWPQEDPEDAEAQEYWGGNAWEKQTLGKRRGARKARRERLGSRARS